jgi:orotidine-5'-phosphate decarboxylase
MTPLFVALDVDDDTYALKLARELKDYVGGFKVGPRLTYKYGESFVSQLAEIGPVFVDNKYHDIPSTMLAALRATFEAGASFATVHASCGPETLRELFKIEKEFNDERPFKILCVTVLTSFNTKNLPANWATHISPSEHVEKLAADVAASGLRGLVCSPEEVSLLRKKYPEAYLVTPGIRLPTDAKGDQSRVMGPAEALKAGASALVVGRPIVEATDPIVAAQNFYKLIRQ